MNKLNTGRGGTTSSSAVKRKLVALLAGFAVIASALLASTPAKADGGLTIQVKTTNLVAHFNVAGCAPDSPVAWFFVAEAGSHDPNADTQPVPGWNPGETSFSFEWVAQKAGEYVVVVTCLGYSGEDQSMNAVFTVTDDKPDVTLSVNPTTWRAGDKVTLTAKGLVAGEDVRFYLGHPQSLDADEVWNVKADSNGVATVTVTWPSKSGYPGKGNFPVRDYVIGATADSLGAYNVVVDVHLDANGVWSLGTTGGQGGGGKGGTLPSTGN